MHQSGDELMKKVLIISAFDNYSYNVRIKYVEKYFENAGYKVEIVSADFDHRNKAEYKVQRKNLRKIHVKPYKKNLSVTRILSHKSFSKESFKYANRYDPDIIYVSTPPNFLFNYASKYKKRHKSVKIIFEIGDMWPETLPISDNIKTIISPALFIWKFIRDHYIKCADAIVFECKLFYKYLKTTIKDVPFKVIYLTKEVDGTVTRTQDITINGNLNLCYVGSLNNIFDENLTSDILNKIALKRPITLHVIGAGEKKDLFLKKLININIIDHGIIYDEVQKKEIYSQCHLALNLMKTNVFVGLTMKSIEYFSAGLPILNNIPEDTSDIIEKYSCGYNFDGDFDKLIKWVGELDDSKINFMKRNSYKVYEQYFTNNEFDKIFSDLLSELE